MKPRTSFFIIAALICAGCGHDLNVATTAKARKVKAGKGNVVGTWTNQTLAGQEPQTVEFRNDGTVTITGHSPTIKGLTIEANAKYKFDGNHYSIKPVSVHLNLSGNPDEKTKETVAVDNAKLDNPANYKNAKADTGTIQWKDANDFSLKDQTGKVVKFSRKA